MNNANHIGYAYDLTAQGRSRLIEWLHDHHRNADRIVSIEEFVDEIVQSFNEGCTPICEVGARHSVDGTPSTYRAWVEEMKLRPEVDEE